MANADLVKCLNPDFHSFLPTDVRFWFKDQDGIKEVDAHTPRFLLVLVKSLTESSMETLKVSVTLKLRMLLKKFSKPW